MRGWIVYKVSWTITRPTTVPYLSPWHRAVRFISVRDVRYSTLLSLHCKIVVPISSISPVTHYLPVMCHVTIVTPYSILRVCWDHEAVHLICPWVSILGLSLSFGLCILSFNSRESDEALISMLLVTAETSQRRFGDRVNSLSLRRTWAKLPTFSECTGHHSSTNIRRPLAEILFFALQSPSSSRGRAWTKSCPQASLMTSWHFRSPEQS